MKSLRPFIVIACAVLSCATPLATRAAVTNGSLIKGASSSAVYYVESGKRYAFPNEGVFFSWYRDFTGVVTVPDTDLAGYALAGNVTYKPAMELVKVTTDPKVYAVSQYGVLRWVMTEDAAAALYGPDWNAKVQDVPDTFFTNYLIGSPIGAATDYNASAEGVIATIGDDLRPAGFVPPTLQTTPPNQAATTGTPSVVVGLSTSQATLNQTVTVFATVSNNVHPIATLEIFSDTSQTPLATCSHSTTCSFPYTIPQAPLDIRFSAVATDDLGSRIMTDVGQQAELNVPAVSTDLILSVTPLAITAGSRVSYSSDASKIQNITSHKVFAMIPGEPNPVLWQDCGTAALCASSSPFYRTTQLYSKVAFDGHVYQSAAATVTVTSGTPPKPTLTLTGHPAANQATLVLTAPSGETIGWSTIVEGTTQDAPSIALCELSSCEVTVQYTKQTTFTGFTDVGGKLESSESVTVTP